MSNTATPIDSKHFRNALGAFATGVTIVTAKAVDGTDVGLTANSFNSVSLDPPMVLWSLARNAASLPVFMETEFFAVHILASDQQPLSDRFARRGTDKFEGLVPARGHGAIPLLAGCSACFQCRTAFRYEGGDHIIFVGEVLEFEHSARPPLLFHSGSYGRILPSSKSAEDATPEIESSIRKDFLGYLLGVSSQQIYRPVRDRYESMGLSEADYYVLTVLAARHACSAEEIDTLLRAVGQRLAEGVLARLGDEGLVKASGDGAACVLELTQTGRRRAIELFAVAKAAEDDAARALDPEEARLLKQLLRRLIRSHGRAPD